MVIGTGRTYPRVAGDAMNDCRCGSGMHPRRCELHPERYAEHCDEINSEAMNDRCPTCDRPNCQAFLDGLARSHDARDCEANRVDWRARFEAERDMCQSINRHFQVARMERDRLRTFVEEISEFKGEPSQMSSIWAVARAQRVLRGEE